MGLLSTPGLDRFDAFRHRRELRRLARMLGDEQALHVVAGRDLRRSGLLCLTDRRALWVSGAWRRTHFPLGELEGVRVGVDGREAVVTLESPTLRLAVARVPADAGIAFADAVRVAAGEAGNHRLLPRNLDNRPKPEPLLSAQNAQERLERLERMRERGTITQPEYLANRKRILERSETGPDPPRGSWWRRF